MLQTAKKSKTLMNLMVPAVGISNRSILSEALGPSPPCARRKHIPPDGHKFV